jgi:hypothetical protein
VVTVDESSGKVEAKAVGTATITAQITVGEVERTVSCTVTVGESAGEDTVTFNVDGADYATRKVASTATLDTAKPANPVKAGCVFVGWKKNVETTEQAEVADADSDLAKDEDSVADKETYEAVFNATITFRDDDGSVLKTETVRYGAKDISMYTGGDVGDGDGWTFLGWATCKNASKAEIAKNGKIETCTGSVTYYAIYKTKMMKYTLKGDNVTYLTGDLKKDDDGNQITETWTAERDGSYIGYQQYADSPKKQTIEFKVEEGYVITSITVKNGDGSEAEEVSEEQLRVAKQYGYIEVDRIQNHEIEITAENPTLTITPTDKVEED